MSLGSIVMVVDDDGELRDSVCELLTEGGYQALGMPSGLAALAYMQGRQPKPDVILLDLMMPQMNGWEFRQAQLHDPSMSGIPVVVMTASGDPQGIQADVVLHKPVALEHLLKVVGHQCACRTESEPAAPSDVASRRVSPLSEGEPTFAGVASAGESMHLEEVTRLLDEARRATRRREETLAMVSHDLRSPLAVISAVAELIQRRFEAPGSNPSPGDPSPGDPRLGRQAVMIRRSVQRMDRLIGDLLDLASIDLGRLALDRSSHTLDQLGQEVNDVFEPQAAQRQVAFATEVVGGHTQVVCDKERIVQVLSNLVSNALRATPQGGSIRLRIAADEAAEAAIFSVMDTGTGIPLELQANLFDRWGQRPRTREGHGLGLSISKGIVEAHRGSFGVKSEPGLGSTFSFTLPLRGADLEQAAGGPAARIEGERQRVQNVAGNASSPAPLAGGNDEGAPGSSDTADARILVVDDNVDLRSYLLRLLGRSFKNIEAAADGQTALELARANPPDLILTDIMMPGLDGLGLIRELRADARTRQVPIILLSARVGEEPTVEGLHAGADDYLTKPFSARELLARVTVHLRMAVVRRAAAEHRAKEQALRRLLAEKDEFLTIASHEFRTPLTTIGLQADGLLRLLSGPLVPDEVGSRLRRRVETVRSSCRRLEEIIERLLDVLAMNDGNPFTEVEPVDVAEVARQVVGRFQQNRQAGPVLSLTTDGPSIGRYDKRAIEQILSNLLSNAIKFGEGKPVDVIVRPEPSLVRIIVQDRGKGIDPKDQERIFDRFGRAVSRNDYGGFGLGLWMVRRLAEALHGVARVESSPGRGSTFTIELPRG